MNEHLETFLNVGHLDLVNASFYLGLLLVFSVNLKKKNNKKQTFPLLFNVFIFFLGFPGGSVDKESACNVGDLGLIPGWRRSPGEGKGYPL